MGELTSAVFYCPKHGRFFLPKEREEGLDDYTKRATVTKQSPCPTCKFICERCRKT